MNTDKKDSKTSNDVDDGEVKEFANQINAISTNTSAIEGFGIEELFTMIKYQLFVEFIEDEKKKNKK